LYGKSDITGMDGAISDSHCAWWFLCLC